jgi:hypothetical protein
MIHEFSDSESVYCSVLHDTVVSQELFRTVTAMLFEGILFLNSPHCNPFLVS